MVGENWMYCLSARQQQLSWSLAREVDYFLHLIHNKVTKVRYSKIESS